MLPIVVGLIAVALFFDYINGFHDAANSIATVVSTRVLSPGKAVVWAAFFNFVAAFVFGTAVAKTIGSGLIDVKIVTLHALIGGLAGAAVAKAGIAAIIPAGWTKTLIFIVLAPLIGMTIGFLLMVALLWVFHRFPPSRVDRWFRKLQLV